MRLPLVFRTLVVFASGLGVLSLAATDGGALEKRPTNRSEYVAIGAGLLHVCAIDGNETVTCAGNNQWGTLGDYSTEQRSRPVSVRDLSGTKQIVGGGGATCALAKAGAVTCWGDNRYGIIGTGSFNIDENTNRIPVTGLTDATQIAMEGPHVCAVTRNASVKCWGYNWFGQVGSGTTTRTETLGQGITGEVTGITKARQVSVSASSSCALVGDGDVLCWGDNSDGQLGRYDIELSTSPLRVPLPQPATQIAMGAYFGCALVEHGDVMCWGSGSNGGVRKVTGVTGATAIAAGVHGACAILRTKTVRCWGSPTSPPSPTAAPLFGRAKPASGLSNVSSLAGGDGFICALTNKGRIQCIGDNSFGQFGNSTKRSSTKPVPAFVH